MAMSFGVIFFLPARESSERGLRRTLMGLTPWRRSSAFTRASLLPDISPFTRLPARSVPSHRNMSCLSACWAMARYSRVTRLISSRLVMPLRTFRSPDWRMSRMPSRRAWSASSMALRFSMMSRRMPSETGIT